MIRIKRCCEQDLRSACRPVCAGHYALGTRGDALRGQYADRRSEFEGSQNPFDDEAKLEITTVHRWT
jgi:hypothetical protein